MRRVLTQGGHLFRQVSTEASKQAATSQQVKGGVAPHGVEGKRVDSRWEAGHMTNLPFPVGRHVCAATPEGWPTRMANGAPDTSSPGPCGVDTVDPPW